MDKALMVLGWAVGIVLFIVVVATLVLCLYFYATTGDVGHVVGVVAVLVVIAIAAQAT